MCLPVTNIRNFIYKGNGFTKYQNKKRAAFSNPFQNKKHLVLTEQQFYRYTQFYHPHRLVL
jgi:hypothetical protein